MAQVSNLKINFQTGSNNTYFASWTFNKPSSGGSSGSIKKGSLVTIKSGATWYNGVAISSWVFNQKWIVVQVKGDRAVLGKNLSGTNNINSPINVKYLVNVGGGSKSVGRAGSDSDTFDHYEVEWFYDSGDGVYFSGSSTTSAIENSVYSAPTNALMIKVSVKPVAKTHTVNNKEVAYWTGTAVTASYGLVYAPPETPSAPTVEIDKYKLTAKLENIEDGRCDQLNFEVYRDTTLFATGSATVLTRRASFSWYVLPGADYRVRCMAVNLFGKPHLSSEWSDFSDVVGTVPERPTELTRCRATSQTSVALKWDESSNATGYNIEYATDKDYFDNSSETTVISDVPYNHYEVTGLETGHEYFFRVRAVNDIGESSWSEIDSVKVGTKPAAPTTWSSTTTAIIGEPLILYWVHNSEDGSKEKSAVVEVYYNDVREEYTVNNPDFGDEDVEDKTKSYEIDTSAYSEGTKIKWRVKTSGVTGEYGDWSIQRTVDIYAPPVAHLLVTSESGAALETLTHFPFNISCTAGPDTQKPISYYISIVSNDTYETVDNVGNKKVVNSGDEIYARFFDTSEDLSISISAGDIDLQSDASYTVVATVSMDSGLTAISQHTFSVKWQDISYNVDASIGIDEDLWVAYISPICPDDINNDLLLSVYRREFDGTFVELGTDIESSSNTWVLDPHPSLDYARYRIVGRSKTTGAISYYDPPGYPVGCSSVIIQWDAEWSEFNTDEEDEMETPPWTGSMLKLPYNIDVSENNSPDVTLVKYIGREHPVGYYGTQKGSSATWNVEIPKSDKDTLYALRRLAIWMGDVYVREPSGSGYWANIKVSFSQKHLDTTIPVTLTLTRVEGGK